jgi:hypothetical protein
MILLGREFILICQECGYADHTYDGVTSFHGEERPCPNQTTSRACKGFLKLKSTAIDPTLETEWQPIETAPKDGRLIEVKAVGRWSAFYNNWEREDGRSIYNVTHWRPR